MILTLVRARNAAKTKVLQSNAAAGAVQKRMARVHIPQNAKREHAHAVMMQTVHLPAARTSRQRSRYGA